VYIFQKQIDRNEKTKRDQPENRRDIKMVIKEKTIRDPIPG
jgi:hypothetical protein